MIEKPDAGDLSENAESKKDEDGSESDSATTDDEQEQSDSGYTAPVCALLTSWFHCPPLQKMYISEIP